MRPPRHAHAHVRAHVPRPYHARITKANKQRVCPPCSPEDQKILETEYQRNPKPDKAARMEIVSKVALGEKEVQVRARFLACSGCLAVLCAYARPRLCYCLLAACLLVFPWLTLHPHTSRSGSKIGGRTRDARHDRSCHMRSSRTSDPAFRTRQLISSPSSPPSQTRIRGVRMVVVTPWMTRIP